MLAKIEDLELSAYDHGYVIEKIGVVPELKKNGEKNKHAGSELRTDQRYYGRIDQAVLRMANLVADQHARSLKEWLTMYENCSMAIIQQLKEVK